eukprot:IDg10377t1
MPDEGAHLSMVAGKVMQVPSGSSLVGSCSASAHLKTPISSIQRDLNLTVLNISVGSLGIKCPEMPNISTTETFLGVSIVVFGPWVSDAVYRDSEKARIYRLDNGFYAGEGQIIQDVVNSSFYQRNVCIFRNEFCEKGSIPVEYLRGSAPVQQS